MITVLLGYDDDKMLPHGGYQVVINLPSDTVLTDLAAIYGADSAEILSYEPQ